LISELQRITNSMKLISNFSRVLKRNLYLHLSTVLLRLYVRQDYAYVSVL